MSSTSFNISNPKMMIDVTGIFRSSMPRSYAEGAAAFERYVAGELDYKFGESR